MAKNYRPAAFPRRPKHSTPFSELRYNFELAYYRWELNTGSYVMSSGEKWALNGTVLSLLLLLVVFIYYCFPITLRMSSYRLQYYLLGSATKSTPSIARIVVDSTTGAAASIAPTEKAMNSSSLLQPII